MVEYPKRTKWGVLSLIRLLLCYHLFDRAMGCASTERTQYYNCMRENFIIPTNRLRAFGAVWLSWVEINKEKIRKLI